MIIRLLPALSLVSSVVSLWFIMMQIMSGTWLCTDVICRRSSLAPCLKRQWWGIHTNLTRPYKGWKRRTFHNHRWQCLQSWVIARRTTTGLRPTAVDRNWTKPGLSHPLGLFALGVQVCVVVGAFWSACLGNQVQVHGSSDWFSANTLASSRSLFWFLQLSCLIELGRILLF